jgi:hypothetical protein
METREFFIAGVQFQKPGLQSCISSMNVGDELDLYPDPDNKFDPNAVQIWYKETLLGHVKRQFSAEIAGMLNLGIPLICTVSALNHSAKSWEQCLVKIEDLSMV